MARFEKGKSGNPGGRPKGQTPRGKFREQVAAAVPQIVDGLVTAALAGDVAAAKVIMDRYLPALKPADEPITLNLPAGSDPVKLGEALVAAVAKGEVSPGQAQAVMAVLNGQRALIEQGQLLRRLEMIETWLQAHARH